MQEKEFSLEQLANLTQSTLVGNPKHLIRNAADLETAKSDDASFLANPRYIQSMLKSSAGVICIDRESLDKHAKECPCKNFLVNDNPSRAFQTIVESFHKPWPLPSAFKGIHPTAVIHETAKLGSNVIVGPHAVIDQEVCIGDRTFIGAGVFIGPESILGTDCIIHPKAVIREQCRIGNRVIIQPGAIIGSCGFGYTTDKQGRHTKLNQVGNVIIEDDVEIGANTTIDRSRFKSTKIGKGTKIDNLVQIGHGVIIGDYNIIISQTGIAGSTETGKYVVLAGQVAVAGHIKLADGVVVSARSGVSKSLTKGTYGGVPAVPIQEFNRNSVYLRNIESFVCQIKEMQKKIKLLEETSEKEEQN